MTTSKLEVIQQQIEQFKAAGITDNNQIVAQLTQLYSMLNIGAYEFETCIASKNILNIMEDLIIPSIIGTHPDAWKEMDAETKEVSVKLEKEYKKLPHLRNLHNLFRRTHGSLGNAQMKILDLYHYRQRKKFRTLNKFAKVMRMESKEL